MQVTAIAATIATDTAAVREWSSALSWLFKLPAPATVPRSPLADTRRQSAGSSRFG